jgi:hypothetical protein
MYDWFYILSNFR